MNETETKNVNIGLIDRPDPPIRKYFDQSEMERLCASIKDEGIIVPLLVRPSGDRFEIIDGDCRLKAAWDAGLREMPVMVRHLSDKQAHLLRMLANKDRQDTDPVSEAEYIAKTVNDKVLTLKEWCEKMGRSDQWIADRMEIASMPEYMKDAMRGQQIKLGVVLELNQVKDAGTKERYFYDALRSGMTVQAAKISRMQVNEAIEALQQRGEEVREDNIPEVTVIPRASCALTGELMLITEMRMVRVGIHNYEKWQKDIIKPQGEKVN